MLSKEEIEKARRYFEDEIHYEKTTYNCVNHYRQTIIDNHIILYKYIEQLETREQKLIEKLEERRKANQEEYDETLYNAHIEETNELKGKLLEDNYILKILKGEN